MNSSPSSPPSPKHRGKSLHPKNESRSNTANSSADNFLTSDAVAQASSRIKLEDNAPKTLPSSEIPSDENFQNFGCSCRANSLLGRRDVSIRGRPKHDSHCDLFFMNPSQRAIKGKLQLFSILISWKLEIQYSRRLFYRDLQIHPAIAIVARSLVSNDSPAFTLVDELVRRTPDITAEALQAQISSVSKDLRCLFRRGRASPGDYNFADQTLLHRASNVHGHLWPDRMSEIWVRFMKELVLMGVPLNESGCFGSALSWFLELRRRERMEHTKRTSQDLPTGSLVIAKGLIELGAPYIDDPLFGLESQNLVILSEYKILTLPDIYQCFSWHLDGFDYGALSSALFEKSEPALRRILMASSSIMIERCHNDQTPLHVAAYWPRGLQLLFELAGDACRQIIDLEDASQLTAIHSAVLLHQVDSVKLLLEQGASIDLENSAIFFGHPYTLDADY
ncbi:uncharacterized protein CLUP02_09888 [Colletotrichum lupini]|uniref:Ankyrin n=1 Tax=Colletotrichum lupini TaxID=145971 RepID=A0A9Q8SVN5_9PEZI|nr:uncharacterized protein CLUP02_09888 [Colletotrichum lupini]UQC84391.1 hypothetical protein CLUP02_09888 [Colletotrichum lupini]